MQQAKVKGLHLWKATLASGLSYSLWITTGRKDIMAATKKSIAVCADSKTIFFGQKVDKLEYSGTIDA